MSCRLEGGRLALHRARKGAQRCFVEVFGKPWQQGDFGGHARAFRLGMTRLGGAYGGRDALPPESRGLRALEDLGYVGGEAGQEAGGCGVAGVEFAVGGVGLVG